MIESMFKKEIEELGDSPIQASMKEHRRKLDAVSKAALDLLEDDLAKDGKDGTTPITVDQKIKIYDTTRRHLNIIDGVSETNQQQNIIILPGELVIDYSVTNNTITEGDIKEQLGNKKKIIINKDKVKVCQKKKQYSSTQAKVKSQKTNIVSE